MAVTYEGMFTSEGHDFFIKSTTGLLDWTVGIWFYV